MAKAIPLGGQQGQRIFRLYHLYRLSIGLALVLLISSNLEGQILTLSHADMFHAGCWGYLIVNILIAVLMPAPHKLLPIFLLALLDILLLCGLFYAAGGAASGIGNLLVISVAIANILLRGRIGLLIAAIAAIGMLYLTFYLSLSQPTAINHYVQAGSLGALCFAAALLLQTLTRRQQLSESLAEERATTVANLQELNELILQRMRTGILVLDSQNRVLLANQSAQSLLAQPNLLGKPLAHYSQVLLDSLQQWLNNPALRPPSMQAPDSGPSLQPSFIPLRRGNDQHTLVFLEDISQIAQQAQQLKLAALGRLTAGIAHEIRNPLGAISHAAQLLQESEALDAADRRLTQIIQDQSRRMNLVIENVLQLSRRRQAEPQLLDLKYWIHRFVGEMRESLRTDQQVHIQAAPGSVQTRMDPNQLTQVLSNLIQNGLRYSAKQHGNGQVWLKLFRDRDSDLPVLEVLDDGPGVAPEQLGKLFEPFFTTESKGTGLGLYISRELCESNQARIDYKNRDEGGGCFRITFAHPRKQS
ncbi:sensor histidine kinase [Pseudomonas panipatensis]|uniref:histidine kinase n=1 Tax=Pseudomonas panipatensis TaxID=428992 RepID=A0A1G8E9C4_9PSED|nr:ATP-binding protein [Pseudomonas panipatensis]SDH66289.1 two-component system, NtrC family, sensor histidine kinase PilS [Pseudomonas panipatensis]SMP37962.1 Sensor protein PilS [Pseudomonas panipatensis]